MLKILIVIVFVAFTVGCEPSGSKDQSETSTPSTTAENTSTSATPTPSTSTATDSSNDAPASPDNNDNASASVSYRLNERRFYTLTLHVVGAASGSRLIAQANSPSINKIIDSSGEYHGDLQGDFNSGTWSVYVTLQHGSERRITVNVTLP